MVDSSHIEVVISCLEFTVNSLLNLYLRNSYHGYWSTVVLVGMNVIIVSYLAIVLISSFSLVLAFFGKTVDRRLHLKE